MKRIHMVAGLVLTAFLGSTFAPPVLHAQRRTATATLPPHDAQSASGPRLAPLPTAPPQSVGFAPDLPAKMDAAMQGLIDSKHLVGIVSLVARKGKVVQHQAYG